MHPEPRPTPESLHLFVDIDICSIFLYVFVGEPPGPGDSRVVRLPHSFIYKLCVCNHFLPGLITSTRIC